MADVKYLAVSESVYEFQVVKVSSLVMHKRISYSSRLTLNLNISLCLSTTKLILGRIDACNNRHELVPLLNLDVHDVINDVTCILQKPDFGSKNSQI